MSKPRRTTFKYSENKNITSPRGEPRSSEAWKNVKTQPCKDKRHFKLHHCVLLENYVTRSPTGDDKGTSKLHHCLFLKDYLMGYFQVMERTLTITSLSIIRILANAFCKKYIKARSHARNLVRLNILSVPRLCCPNFSITNSLWYGNLEVNWSSAFA